MSSILLTTVLIDAGARLAKTIIDIWRTRKELRQRELDRTHQRQLQKAQHEHELYMETVKSKPPKKYKASEIDIDENLLKRFNEEAELLSIMGFSTVFEPIGNGFGLAIPINTKNVIAFWLPPNYPDEAPRVFSATAEAIDEIKFSDNAWNKDIMMSDVIISIAESESS